ncbi:MAG: ribosome assembly cofactor RimP [Bacteroidales bacterium]|jgi:ribosome maturation factor RimP|nr:ribosome assembly cofactor RimP [Bacteroidales bacterium]
MISETYIRQLIDEKLSGTDVFLVECRVKTDNKIRVFIDSERGVAIEDCIALSRHIEGNLDREQEDFALDVSSAGLDLPLRIPRQFKKNVGRSVQVILNDGTEVKGKMIEATDEHFQVLPDAKKPKKSSKQTETEPIQPISIHYINQKETKIVLTF